MKREPYRPDRALLALVRHEVRFVLIGGVAANALGSPTATFDTDICYARDQENLERLTACLISIHATLRGAPKDIPFILDAKTLQMGDAFTFDTDVGPLDCIGTPTGSSGYGELRANASPLTVSDVEVNVASIDDLIRMKRAAGRPKDLLAVEYLGALREEIDDAETRKRKRRRKPPRKR